MNKKGFTMVELIAMMTVLGILMLIAVPNISGILKNNRENVQVEDINKMIETAKRKFKNNEVAYPENDSYCAVLTLSAINDNDDFTTGVNGGTYVGDASYIIVKKVVTGSTYEYEYYVKLVEQKGSKFFSMGPVDYSTFSENPKKYSAIKVAPSTVIKITDSSVVVKDEINEAYKKQSGRENLCAEISSFLAP